MTKQCSLKESFVETQLDKYQPGWRSGEDITSETKQKIRDYIIEKLPDDLKDDVTCITNYSIFNMAQKIRKREGLPSPKKSNKGKRNKKVGVCKPEDKVGVSKPEEVVAASEGGIVASKPEPADELTRTIKGLVESYGYPAVSDALQLVAKNTIPTEVKT